jgi:ribonuclease-3
MDPTDSAQERVRRLEERLGVSFSDRALAERALTHASARETGRTPNERLEFLGDAVLGHIICEHLFRRFPDLEEGDLSQVKAVLVSAATLADVAQRLGLHELLILGRGLSRRRALPPRVLANAFEAVLAAVYLDCGFDAARRIVLEHIATRTDEVLGARYGGNYKSLLQDYTQRRYNEVPHYEVVDEAGPDHRKIFRVRVSVRGRPRGTGEGTSKKDAEQAAARNALIALGVLPKEGADREEE